MTLREYLDTVRTRWRFVIVGLLLGVIVGGAVTLTTPQRYSADVTVFVSARGGGDAASALDAGDLASQRVATYLEVLTSPRVAQEVADAVGSGLTAQQVSEELSARSTQDTLLLTATVTDASPERAARIANLVAERFVANVTELETIDPALPPPVTAKVFEPAQVPTDPVVPRPAVNLMLGALIGLLVGIGLAVLRHRTDTSVKSADQLRAVVDVPVLGTIEADQAVGRTPLIAEAASGSRVAEDFRQLRTNLQFLDVDRERLVWLVTSPTPGAGKTTTVANLALVLAEAGGRVLVIEADLRRPRLAEILGVDRSIGLTNVLVRRMPGGQAVRRVRPGLDVLASGPLPPNPSELLGSAAMAGLLAQTRERYDVVLVDASPLSPVTDAAALARQVDGVLLVVPHGAVSRQQVLAARDALETVSAPLLGAVLTRVPPPRKRRTSADEAYLAVHSELDIAPGERPLLAPAWSRPAERPAGRPLGGTRPTGNGNGNGSPYGRGPRVVPGPPTGAIPTQEPPLTSPISPVSSPLSSPVGAVSGSGRPSGRVATVTATQPLRSAAQAERGADDEGTEAPGERADAAEPGTGDEPDQRASAAPDARGAAGAGERDGEEPSS